MHEEVKHVLSKNNPGKECNEGIFDIDNENPQNFLSGKRHIQQREQLKTIYGFIHIFFCYLYEKYTIFNSCYTVQQW